jgi:hypothetical protein
MLGKVSLQFPFMLNLSCCTEMNSSLLLFSDPLNVHQVTPAEDVPTDEASVETKDDLSKYTYISAQMQYESAAKALLPPAVEEEEDGEEEDENSIEISEEDGEQHANISNSRDDEMSTPIPATFIPPPPVQPCDDDEPLTDSEIEVSVTI